VNRYDVAFWVVVGSLVVSVSLWYFYVTSTYTELNQKCYMEICREDIGPDVCFGLQLRNVSTDPLKHTDCWYLREKCKLRSMYNESEHYFFRNCTWNEKEGLCTCMID